MAGKVMRATQTYYAGPHMVREGTLLSEGDPRLIDAYVEEFGGPEPPPPTPAKRGRPKKDE